MSESEDGVATPRGTAPKRGSRRKAAEPAASLNAGDLFVSPVQINADQLIHYIKEQAAEQASQAARERLNFFFTIMGLFLAIVGAIGVGTLFSLGDRIKSDLEKTIEESITASKVDLENNINDRFAILRAETSDALREEMSAVILLPLLVSEASSFSAANYRTDDRDRILTVIRALKPEILALEGEARIIALRRIEDILDALYGVGDYMAALDLYDIFGTELLEQDGIQHSMARIFAALLLHDREFPSAQDEMLETFIGKPYDRKRRGVRTYMHILFIVLAMIEGKDDAALALRMTEEEMGNPGFVDEFAVFLGSLRYEFGPDGVNTSAFGIANLDRLEGVILDVRADSAATSAEITAGETASVTAEENESAPVEGSAPAAAAQTAASPERTGSEGELESGPEAPPSGN